MLITYSQKRNIQELAYLFWKKNIENSLATGHKVNFITQPTSSLTLKISRISNKMYNCSLLDNTLTQEHRGRGFRQIHEP